MLQALSLAGGVTENGAMNRVQIVRIVAGGKKEIKVKPDRHRQARRHHHRAGEVFLDERPVELRARVAAEAAAGGAGRPRSGPGPAACSPRRRPPLPVAGGAAGRRRAPDRLREGALQAPLDGGDGVPAGDGGVTVYTFTATPIYEARTRLLIEAESQNVVIVQGSHRRGSDQGRLLPDAVQHPAVARAGAQDARGPEAVGSPAVQSGDEQDRGLQRRGG